MKQVVVLGSGNVAYYFCKQLLLQSQFQLVQLYARNLIEGEAFSNEFEVLPVVNEFSKVVPDADVYIFAVADAAIGALAQYFKTSKALLIHCAGSQSTNILQNEHGLNGIIWPIYSIKKNQTYGSDIPLIVDGNSEMARAGTLELAKAISSNVQMLSLEQRKYMHLNAVLVNNFSNHLMAIAAEICKAAHIDFNILLPIIQQTAERVVQQSPVGSQTGPAKRGDKSTMEQQVNLLEHHPEWQKVYESLSASIAKMYE